MTHRLRIAGIGLAFLATTLALSSSAQQGTNAFNQVAGRTAEDPTVVAQGKTLYGINCQACHGSDLRGGDLGGPNLLRSTAAMGDRRGENIVPIIQGGRQAQGMPKIGINLEDSEAVAAYIRSVIGTIGGQGKPPGPAKELNVVVGDAARGKAYFGLHCASCHSVAGDLRGVGTRYGGARKLQASWIKGAAMRGDDPAVSGIPSATVTLAGGRKVSGDLLRIDDFAITMKMPDGTRQSFRRVGNVPTVEVRDPARAHSTLLPLYTDADIHDVTAYLVTIK